MTTGSMLDVPPAGRSAAFAPGFGQRVLLTVDTEEEFDWTGPFRREGYGLSHVEAIPRFQTFCETLGAHPVYLVDWPIVQDARAVEIIGDAVRRGTAEVGGTVDQGAVQIEQHRLHTLQHAHALRVANR